MKQFLTAIMCGCRASSSTWIPSSRILRNLQKTRRRPGKVQRYCKQEHALVNRLKGAGDGEVVLKLDGDTLVRQRLEYGEDQLRSDMRLRSASGEAVSESERTIPARARCKREGGAEIGRRLMRTADADVLKVAVPHSPCLGLLYLWLSI
jgi:hypothetical protein